MGNQARNPFTPFVTVDHIVRFDPQRRESDTGSRFVNAVLRAIFLMGAADTRRIAHYLAMDERTLNCGVRIACGMGMAELRRVVAIAEAARMYAANPKTNLDDIAANLGFANRSSIWVILNDKRHAALAQRLCPSLLGQRGRSAREE